MSKVLWRRFFKSVQHQLNTHLSWRQTESCIQQTNSLTRTGLLVSQLVEYLAQNKCYWYGTVILPIRGGGFLGTRRNSCTAPTHGKWHKTAAPRKIALNLEAIVSTAILHNEGNAPNIYINIYIYIYVLLKNKQQTPNIKSPKNQRTEHRLRETKEKMANKWRDFKLSNRDPTTEWWRYWRKTLKFLNCLHNDLVYMDQHFINHKWIILVIINNLMLINLTIYILY